MPARRDTATAKQVVSASAEKSVHQDGAAPDASGRPNQQPAGREQAAFVNKVSIDNFTFNPQSLEVAAGTKVIWVNGDDVPHTVRSNEDTFRSGTLDTDDVYERLFSEPGTYEYYCGVHPHMTGKIVVK